MTSKTLMIAGHEFKKTVTKKGFLFGTFGLPLFMVFVFVLAFSQMPALVGELSGSGIGFVDESGLFSPSGSFIRYDSAESASLAFVQGEISEYFTIPADYMDSGTVTVYSEKSILGTQDSGTGIGDFIRENLVAASVDDPASAERIITPVVKTEYITIDDSGAAAEEQSIGMMLVPMVMSFMLVFSILTSSAYLMQGIGEEKESRSGELLLSSVSADQLLRGKILGYGGVGFVQLAVYLAVALVLLQLLPLSGLLGEVTFSWIFIVAIVYFILGYFLFSVSISCTASIASTQAEANQTSMIFTMFAIIPLMLLEYIVSVPDSPIAVVLTYFPYTSPFMVTYRMALESVPLYEIAVSMAILVASILIAVKLSAKLFRAGMLMYGKKPGLREIIKVLRN